MNSTKINKIRIQREEIITLIKQGISIPKISKKLGINKSKIYYHYKKIKGRKYSLEVLPSNNQVIGEFLGAFAGDGSCYYDKKRGHYTINFHLHAKDDKQYGLFLQKTIKKNFKKKVRSYSVKNELRLVFYSKKVFEFIEGYLTIEKNKTLNVSLRWPLNAFSKQFKASFVRGLFDTDGHVRQGGRLALGLISEQLILQVSNILKEFEIDNRIYLRKKLPNQHRLYELTIPRRYLATYLKRIGFSNKRKNAVAEIRTPDPSRKGEEFSGHSVGNAVS